MELDWVFIAPVVGSLGMLLIVALVLLLWPLSRRSAELIQLLVEERRRGDSQRQLAEMAAVLGRIEEHLAQLEERQQFTEALLAERPARIAVPASAGRESVEG